MSAGCGTGNAPLADLSRGSDEALAGVVVTVRVLDRKEAIGAFVPATVIVRDQGFVRWVSLNPNLRQIVVRDSAAGSAQPDHRGDTFVLNVNEKGTRDYSCDLQYTARAPVVVANYRRQQDS